jgi:hypothetical protein
VTAAPVRHHHDHPLGQQVADPGWLGRRRGGGGEGFRLKAEALEHRDEKGGRNTPRWPCGTGPGRADPEAASTEPGLGVFADDTDDACGGPRVVADRLRETQEPAGGIESPPVGEENQRVWGVWERQHGGEEEG